MCEAGFWWNVGNGGLLPASEAITENGGIGAVRQETCIALRQRCKRYPLVRMVTTGDAMKRTVIALCLLPLLLCGCPDNVTRATKAATGDVQPPAPSAAAAAPAEYALRWTPPATDLDQASHELKDVLSRLQRSATPLAALPKAKTYAVSYYDVAAANWPEDYKASLRQRSRQKDGETEVELNYKVRGKAPLPSPFPASTPVPTAA